MGGCGGGGQKHAFQAHVQRAPPVASNVRGLACTALAVMHQSAFGVHRRVLGLRAPPAPPARCRQGQLQTDTPADPHTAGNPPQFPRRAWCTCAAAIPRDTHTRSGIGRLAHNPRIRLGQPRRGSTGLGRAPRTGAQAPGFHPVCAVISQPTSAWLLATLSFVILLNCMLTQLPLGHTHGGLSAPLSN